jgi:hypothetical protein
VEFEAMKHENKRLQEETEDLHIQMEEMINLRRIVEKNLEETLASLQVCRFYCELRCSLWTHAFITCIISLFTLVH